MLLPSQLSLRLRGKSTINQRGSGVICLDGEAGGVVDVASPFSIAVNLSHSEASIRGPVLHIVIVESKDPLQNVKSSKAMMDLIIS